MKTLELKQMENLRGGTDSCGPGPQITAAIGLYSAIFFAACPIGWGLAGIALLGAYYTVQSCLEQ